MRVREFEVSNGFGRWMYRHDWAGFTLPVPFYGAVIFYWLLDSSVPPSARTRRHERTHADQIARYGALGFTVRYFYYLIRYGYSSNPFELSAYEAESKERALRSI